MERQILKLITSLDIDDLYVSFAIHSLVIEKLRERLLVSQWVEQRFYIGRFNLKKLHEVKAKEEDQLKVSSRLAAINNLDN
jgi:hypothetical protein